jgi:two-component system CheB/CheR fusion protein
VPDHTSDQDKPVASKTTQRDTHLRGPPNRTSGLGVVGIGASAGGLQVFTKLVSTLPVDSGMAFVLVQHLDPNHDSLLVELLAEHTTMPVLQAIDGAPLRSDCITIIPPGTYLAVENGALSLSPPQTRHGIRLPFDFLLRSLAKEFGARAMCVVLSGTGADGSLGLTAVSGKNGLVIAQTPEEATYDGMPRSAIKTGAVDLILPVDEIAAALVRFNMAADAEAPTEPPEAPEPDDDWLTKIIDLLRSTASHDFRLYKHGTLQRRIERRMAMAAINPGDMEQYFTLLNTSRAELELLATDLLINVTGFFRDSKVFKLLEQKTIPDLIRAHTSEEALRVWVAGCSTGQEAYSLAILFREQLAALNSSTKLQIFASDIDADAVAIARDGLYPAAIESEVSAKRLATFFKKDDLGYRVVPDLRGTIVFTVQDVLADPPFSRLDMVSCRNLLIYLKPGAQQRVTSTFHFALREGGLLLLGSAETISNGDGHFESLSKEARLYRHVGLSRPVSVGNFASGGESHRLRAIGGSGAAVARQSTLAELCRRMVVECFAPAAVLINRNHACLYSLGPTDRYLRVASGHHTNDLLAMARPGTRGKLKAVIQQVYRDKARVTVPGGRVRQEGGSASFNLDVQPVSRAGEELLLICFVEATGSAAPERHRNAARVTPRATELEEELAATRVELRGALHDLETSSEEQKAVNEEALSVNEEFQSTNEELLTSKEELQSLNEELTVLNHQLQETLERQRTTSDDLQNVLYSTDVATLFLDLEFKIRFFTPASKTLFNIIATDVGRPLADLRSLAADADLLDDAKAVLDGLAVIEREVETTDSTWFLRRILPYRAHNQRIEGVVITCTDVTERKRIAGDLATAKQHAESANLAKGRFLAAASHDLRQPLQTLTLLQGLLAKSVDSERGKKLVMRQGETLTAMSGMLNTLLDINEIESGVVHSQIINFSMNEMLERLQSEFSYHAQAQGIGLTVMPCTLDVVSDPRLLEQMVRNLLSNALKYTRRGKVLLGCRRRPGMLSIEIWDTGIGIPENQLQAIFDEYHQIDNAARERSRGLGLGLSIVQRLGNLLGHKVRLCSRPEKGSMFAIDIALPAAGSAVARPNAQLRRRMDDRVPAHRTGVILVVEDDPEVREALQLFLQDDGHLTVITRDGLSALELLARGTIRPDIIIADYNLPNGLDGLQLGLRLRKTVGVSIPMVILTGDISAETMLRVTQHNFIHLTKPVNLDELTRVIQMLLPAADADRSPLRPALAKAALAGEAFVPAKPHVFIVDDDARVCEATRGVLEEDGYSVTSFQSGEAFLEAYAPASRQCVLIDACLPGMSGLDLLKQLRIAGHGVPAIIITGNSDVAMAVLAMKSAASDFIEKPIGRVDLLASVGRALEEAQDLDKRDAWHQRAAGHLASLTPRQRQIMAKVLAGLPNKNIAADLAISQRTVENHRAAIMRKTGAASLPALARLAFAASWNGPGEPPPGTA